MESKRRCLLDDFLAYDDDNVNDLFRRMNGANSCVCVCVYGLFKTEKTRIKRRSDGGGNLKYSKGKESCFI